MKKNPFWLFLWVFLLINSCIVMRSRQVDDGTKSLTKEDSAKILPFDYGSIHKIYEYPSPSNILFQKIETDNLKNIIAEKKFSLVMFVASWCPVSEKSLIKNTQLIPQFPEDSIQLIIISQDLNIKNLQKEIFEANYNHIPYLLVSKKYGTDEVFKQEKFIKDFDKRILIDRFKGGGVPKNLLFNSKAELLFVTGGTAINCDTIKKYTHLVCKRN
jgi:thiol-disulfide isomerase/thioredoxin